MLISLAHAFIHICPIMWISFTTLRIFCFDTSLDLNLILSMLRSHISSASASSLKLFKRTQYLMYNSVDIMTFRIQPMVCMIFKYEYVVFVGNFVFKKKTPQIARIYVQSVNWLFILTISSNLSIPLISFENPSLILTIDRFVTCQTFSFQQLHLDLIRKMHGCVRIESERYVFLSSNYWNVVARNWNL